MIRSVGPVDLRRPIRLDTDRTHFVQRLDQNEHELKESPPVLYQETPSRDHDRIVRRLIAKQACSSSLPSGSRAIGNGLPQVRRHLEFVERLQLALQHMKPGLDAAFRERYTCNAAKIRRHVYAFFVKQDHSIPTVPPLKVANLVHHVLSDPNLIVNS